MPKGYPKSHFEIVNQTQIQSIDTTPVSTPTAVYMQPYTSDKGTEDWELLTSFDGFTKSKGGISFNRHGQSQLTVARALRSGAYVFAKRVVADDAKLANTTICARLVVVDNVTYVYYYAASAIDCEDFNEACIGNTYEDKESATDIPLFTVTAMGRGESLAFFRINPIKMSSKSRNTNNYIKYTFEVIEDNDTIESIVFTMNPDIMIDDVSQSLDSKVKNNSTQVRVKLYEDGIYRLVNELSKTAVDSKSNKIYPADLVNMDFINGFDSTGNNALGGIVTCAISDKAKKDLWSENKPEDINGTDYDLGRETGIPLSNGSFGSLTSNPMSKPEELTKLLCDVFGKGANGTSAKSFDPIIYDLDAYKIDAIFDCCWDTAVKNAIIEMVEFRQDMVFLCDLGMNVNTFDTIKAAAEPIKYSNFVALYHNYFNIIDPFLKKEITVTMPYNLIDKLTSHIAKGVGRPFAGINNNIYFTNIIDKTVNYYPVNIPGLDQKQDLIDINVNYLSLYDGVPVMESMYVNSEEYSQLSYLHNIMAIQEIVKIVRTRCPRTRYTFLDSNDLETYISDVESILKEYSTNFKSLSCEYMADEQYEQNNVFYAVIKVQFKNFIQEEYFKIIAIS